MFQRPGIARIEGELTEEVHGLPRALGAAAHDDMRLYASEVRQRFQLGDRSGLQKALHRLNDLELIETVQRGTYRVPDLFLRASLRETSEPMSG